MGDSHISNRSEQSEKWSRRGILAALGAVPAATLLTGCGGGSADASQGSGEKTVEPSNGLNGWNLSWADWKAGSAVRTSQ